VVCRRCFGSEFQAKGPAYENGFPDDYGPLFRTYSILILTLNRNTNHNLNPNQWLKCKIRGEKKTIVVSRRFKQTR